MKSVSVTHAFVCSILMASLVFASACSHSATIHRYGAPSLESEIVASDSETLVVQDEYGNDYEVPVLTVTHVDHPGVGWMIAGSVLAAIGVIFSASIEGTAGQYLGGTYLGLGFAVGMIGGLPHVRSRMNASAADLRSDEMLVPGTEMPPRRIGHGRAPMGPAKRP